MNIIDKNDEIININKKELENYMEAKNISNITNEDAKENYIKEKLYDRNAEVITSLQIGKEISNEEKKKKAEE